MPSGSLLPLALVASIGAFLIHEVCDLDVWWHLAIGSDILEHAAVPTHDRFAAAALDRPYHDSHWLFQVLLAVAHRLGGFVGVQVVVVAFWSLALCFCHRAIRRWAGPAPSAVLLFVAAMASVERFLPRPEIVSFLMLAVFYERLQDGRFRSARDVALLGTLQLLWTNDHGLFVLGPFLVGCYGVVELLRQIRGRPSETTALGRLLALLLLATLMTPYGAGGWRYAGTLLAEAGPGSGLPPVGELSPTLGAAARSAPAFWFFLPLLAGTVAASAIALRRGEASPRLLVAAGLAAAALSGRRQMPLFALVGAPLLAEQLSHLAPRGLRWPRLATAGSALWMLAAAWFALSGRYALKMEIPARPGLGATPSFFPHALPAFLDRVGFRGQVFNSNTLGGFCLYHGLLPLTDGRWEIYDRQVLEWIRKAPGDRQQWERLVSRFDIRGILLQHASAEARLLLPRLPAEARWRLVYFDHAASFWMRADAPGLPPSAPSVLPPQPARVDDCLMLDLFLRDVRSLGLRFENLQRALAFGWNRDGLLERVGLVQIELGRFRDAEATFDDLVRRHPRHAQALNELAFLALRRGDLAAAAALLRRALEIDPGNADFLANSQRVREALRQRQTPPQAEGR